MIYRRENESIREGDIVFYREELAIDGDMDVWTSSGYRWGWNGLEWNESKQTWIE